MNARFLMGCVLVALSALTSLAQTDIQVVEKKPYELVVLSVVKTDGSPDDLSVLWTITSDFTKAFKVYEMPKSSDIVFVAEAEGKTVTVEADAINFSSRKRVKTWYSVKSTGAQPVPVPPTPPVIEVPEGWEGFTKLAYHESDEAKAMKEVVAKAAKNFSGVADQIAAGTIKQVQPAFTAVDVLNKPLAASDPGFKAVAHALEVKFDQLWAAGKMRKITDTTEAFRAISKGLQIFAEAK